MTGGGGGDDQLAMTDETRRRLRARRRRTVTAACVALAPVAGLGGLALALLASRAGPGPAEPGPGTFAFILAVAVVAGAIPIGWVRFAARASTVAEGDWWWGPVTVDPVALRAAPIGGSIHVRGRRRLVRSTFGGRPVRARLTIGPGGFHWRFGRSTGWAGARGAAWLAWEQVSAVEVGDVPLALNRGVGGAVVVWAGPARAIDGTFVGSRGRLRAACARGADAQAWEQRSIGLGAPQ